MSQTHTQGTDGYTGVTAAMQLGGVLYSKLACVYSDLMGQTHFTLERHRNEKTEILLEIGNKSNTTGRTWQPC